MAEQLLQQISATREAFAAEPARAQHTFKTRSALSAGLRSDVSIRQHAVVIDEPESIGGGDAGPSPIEMLLAALASCQEITYKAYATALGIELTRVSIELEGDIDLSAFFGVNDNARAGFSAIRGTITLESPAPREALEKLKQTVDQHCPVLDMLSTPVPTKLTLA